MGACTFTSVQHGVTSNGKRVVEAVVTFSDSYATAGDTVALTSLGLRRIDEVHVPSHRLSGAAVSDAQAQTGISLQLAGTVAAPKLKAYVSATTEQTAAVDQSTVATVVRFVGT